ncbi:hypothetical protein B0H17DRAFT_1094112 [Mycena rosella]|uniref:Uncharacterized protein n=1 Tax=Mycena rosella TaxID=1033263 RepID=A0AAD7G372_MYCRO|nr:hypothetical protein B0H17DRAFT_1094112 [Mycena rosella]
MVGLRAQVCLSRYKQEMPITITTVTSAGAAQSSPFPMSHVSLSFACSCIQEGDASCRSALRKSILSDTRKMLGQISSTAAAADERSRAADERSRKLVARLALRDRHRAGVIDAEVARLTESLQDMNLVLRYEVLNRIMKALDWDVMSQLSEDDVDLLKNTKSAWVGALIDVYCNSYDASPEVQVIAVQACQSLSAADIQLFLFCREAAYQYRKESRHGLQHPTPTVDYAHQIMATMAGDMGGYQLDPRFVHTFIDHAANSSRDQPLFSMEDDRDPRRQLENDISNLECEREPLILD